MRLMVLFVLLCIFLSLFVGAHVGYVLDAETFDSGRGSDALFLISALIEPFNIFLMVFTALIVGALYFVTGKWCSFRREARVIERQTHDYSVYVPLLARIGLAILLIGAGTARVLFSPVISTTTMIGTLEIALGFLLFTGLFVGIASFAVLLLYFVTAFSHPYLLGNFDIIGLCLTLLALRSERPGFGDIFGMQFFGGILPLKRHVPRILSSCIGIAFMYLALFEKLLNPHLSRLVVEKYLLTSVISVSSGMWVLSAGIVEFLVGLLLFIRFKPRLISSIALVVISVTFFFFKEAVYSHITLFITLFLIFVLGKCEPVKETKKLKS
jgi:uncharacterized membrane protein YphA (DoxX/SURF4 family)